MFWTAYFEEICYERTLSVIFSKLINFRITLYNNFNARPSLGGFLMLTYFLNIFHSIEMLHYHFFEHLQWIFMLFNGFRSKDNNFMLTY